MKDTIKNFLRGVGSIMSIAPSVRRRTNVAGIQQDWEAVGKYLTLAVKDYDEHRNSGRTIKAYATANDHPSA